jgi:hypothetical protein
MSGTAAPCLRGREQRSSISVLGRQWAVKFPRIAAEIITRPRQKYQCSRWFQAKKKKEIVIAIKFHNNGNRCAVQTEGMITHYF